MQIMVPASDIERSLMGRVERTYLQHRVDISQSLAVGGLHRAIPAGIVRLIRVLGQDTLASFYNEPGTEGVTTAL